MGAWPIIFFGIAEFIVLVVCTYLFYENSKKGEKISLRDSKIFLDKTLEDKEYRILEYNLAWTKIKNENDSLSMSYSGKKTFLQNFLVIKEELN